MGFGKSEQIYKEATKQKLIHVEDEQTKQSQKQGQSQPEQMQQKKTDLLENVMQKYQLAGMGKVYTYNNIRWKVSINPIHLKN